MLVNSSNRSEKQESGKKSEKPITRSTNLGSCGPNPRRHGAEPDPFGVHLLPGADIHFHIGPSEQTVPFRVEQQDLVLHLRGELHPKVHPPVHRPVRSAASGISGAPLLGGLVMTLVESVEGGVGEWACGVDVDEDQKRETNGVVSDTFVLVGVGEFELEDDGVVGVVVVGCCVERGKVEGLEEAFGMLGAESEPEEEGCEADADEEAHAAREAVVASSPGHLMHAEERVQKLR
ncbi:hypothetical protein SESBI_01103 [Sesbania bispinosa]|nr:hypothetical protein SESBI_01103 [Sesbania bispinosa]